MTRLSISPLAEQDLEALADYIAQDSPDRALRFIQGLREQFGRLAQHPSAYRRRPELGDDLRSCTYGHYAIFFVATPSEVTILRILHGARDLPALFGSDPGMHQP